MNFRDFQREALKTDWTGEDAEASLEVALLGLAGETGSLLTEFKKRLRDGHRYRVFTDQVSEEIGDILWYLAKIADQVGLDLQEVALVERHACVVGSDGGAFPGPRFRGGQGGAHGKTISGDADGGGAGRAEGADS